MKKIMFNDKYGLTKAVLEGRKTQTRRIVTDKLFQECRSNGLIDAGGFNDEWETKSMELLLKNSLYEVGEEVAVAQSYRDAIKEVGCLKNLLGGHPLPSAKGIKNKMFVKADLMPHRIKITNVRLERLQDIGDEDCLKEGIHKMNNPVGYASDCIDDKHTKHWWFRTPREAFAAIIGKVSGKGTWDSNPWVFVYDFELIK